MIGVLAVSAPVRSRTRRDMMEVCCLSSSRSTTPVRKPGVIPPTAPQANGNFLRAGAQRQTDAAPYLMRQCQQVTCPVTPLFLENRNIGWVFLSGRSASSVPRPDREHCLQHQAFYLFQAKSDHGPSTRRKISLKLGKNIKKSEKIHKKHISELDRRKIRKLTKKSVLRSIRLIELRELFQILLGSFSNGLFLRPICVQWS